MKSCPFCKTDTQVTDTRLVAHTNYIRRRRECNSCKYRFSTIEIPAAAAINLARLAEQAKELAPLADPKIRRTI